MAKKKPSKPAPAIHSIPINMPPPGWKQHTVVTITWDTSYPVAAGGYNSANVRVTCILTGPNVNMPMTAVQTTATDWNVNFGVVPPGHYNLQARGSDGSSFQVAIEVQSR
jgi:hypothetical protein